MTYYPDGSPYQYGPAPNTGLVCAGWLAAGHPYPEGEPPDGFLDRLAWRCVNQTDRPYRGIHVCELCPKDHADFVSVVREGKKHLLGCAEITVIAGTRIYAAPNLILHYVAAHGYQPSKDFVDAVMAGSSEESLSDWTLFTGPYWDV